MRIRVAFCESVNRGPGKKAVFDVVVACPSGFFSGVLRPMLQPETFSATNCERILTTIACYVSSPRRRSKS